MISDVMYEVQDVSKVLGDGCENLVVMSKM